MWTLFWLVLVLLYQWPPSFAVITNSKCAPLTPQQLHKAVLAARKYAPLVWLAPGERYFPSSVLDFLDNTQFHDIKTLPGGPESRHTYLKTAQEPDILLANSSSFLHGFDPTTYSVPVYAVVNSCCAKGLRIVKSKKTADKNAHENSSVEPDKSNTTGFADNATQDRAEEWFQITYWLFFPYSEGKKICTVNGGTLGPLPFPWLRSACLGKIKTYGSHVGDWEHVTLAFQSSGLPVAMYVSTHDVGAVYAPLVPDPQRRSAKLWSYVGHELRRGTRLQTPRFPRRAISLPSGRPMLFAAKGSHGLWTLPGRHKYVTFPNLEDFTGFGALWRTWRNIQIVLWPLQSSSPRWLHFQGYWGNPRNGCHPLSSQVCEMSDGPQGIPAKKHARRCLHHFTKRFPKTNLFVRRAFQLPALECTSVRTSQ